MPGGFNASYSTDIIRSNNTPGQGVRMQFKPATGKNLISDTTIDKNVSVAFQNKKENLC